MGTGFEVTPDDVMAVAERYGVDLGYELADSVYDEYVLAEADTILDAALMGDGMEEQTEYAYEELARVLDEAGVIRLDGSA